MIPRRLNSQIKLVSHFDPEYINEFGVEEKEKYTETLKIEHLGDISEMPRQKRPAVFVCDPLNIKYEYMVYSEAVPDYWGVFATHVKDIQNYDLDLEKDNMGNLTDKVREDIPPEFVHDIALKIINLANRSPESAFFFKPVGSSAYERSVMAKKRAQIASMVAVKSNHLKQEENPKMDVTVTSTVVHK